MKKIFKGFICLVLLMCCVFLLDISMKITASAQEAEVDTTEVEMLSTDSGAIQVAITVVWEDYADNYYPLNGYLLRLYKDNEIIVEDYLNEDGEFSYSFDSTQSHRSDESFLIKIEILSSDKVFSVVQNVGDLNLYWSKTIEERVYPGDVKNINIIIPKEEHLLNKSIQIINALYLARNYATEMMGEAPDPINVVYPTNKGRNFYDHTTQTINILYNIYTQGDELKAFTDMVIHEYGHHIQYQIGMTYEEAEYEIFLDNGGNHSFSQNQLNNTYYTKELALKVAWIEGWATAFAMQVKNYFAPVDENNQYYSFIDPTTSRIINQSDQPYDIENGCPTNGEACEGSIVGILWDIWDSGTGDDDGINMSYQDWWDLTTKDIDETTEEYDPILNMYNFIKVFYDNNSESINELYKILFYYEMLPEYIKDDHKGIYVEWLEEKEIELYMIACYDISNNYYNFAVDPNCLPGEALMIGFTEGDGYFYYVACVIEDWFGEAYDSTLYISVEGTGWYCWLLNEDGTMVDVCMREGDELVIPFTDVYNSETGEFYLYPTTGNNDMIEVSDIEARLEIVYREYIHLYNPNAA